MAQAQIHTPKFTPTIIQKRTDGYWIEAATFDPKDHVPGVISSGIDSGDIYFLDNPVARGESPEGVWEEHLIANLNRPVALTTADITGNGCSDVIACFKYGASMLECDPNGGEVIWLENPGRKKLEDGGSGQGWKSHKIGRWPAMHRLLAGHFTQRAFIEVIGAPVVRGPHNLGGPVPIHLFQCPTFVDDATEWNRSIIDDQDFTIIHDITAMRSDGAEGLDSILISSREGVSRLYYSEGKWKREVIGIGEPQELQQSAEAETPGFGQYWGSGNSAVGKFGKNSCAYVAAADPFHGNILSVYTKVYGNFKFSWKRKVIDRFGTPVQRLKNGEGPIHFVTCGDFDGDGNDEILVSLMGPVYRDDKPEIPNVNPHKGIYYYKLIDLETTTFAKWKVSNYSSARVAVGDLNGNGPLDFASICYHVQGYYEEPDPVVHLFKNELIMAQAKPSDIFPSFWEDEVIVHLRNPRLSPVEDPSLPPYSLMEVANFKISVQVLWRGHEIEIPQLYTGSSTGSSTGPKIGIKVLFGALKLLDKNGNIQEERKPFSAVWPETPYTTIPDTVNSLQANDKEGAIILILESLHVGTHEVWADATKIPVKPLMDMSALGLKPPNYHWRKVNELPWGGSYADDFWNMLGIHFRLYEDDTPIAHIQFWAAGRKVDAGLHNHRHDLFGEVHLCLSNGTKNGGMRCAKSLDAPVETANELSEEGFEFRKMDILQEHGGMWHRLANGKGQKREDNTLIYPMHAWLAGKEPYLDIWAVIEFDSQGV